MADLRDEKVETVLLFDPDMVPCDPVRVRNTLIPATFALRGYVASPMQAALNAIIDPGNADPELLLAALTDASTNQLLDPMLRGVLRSTLPGMTRHVGNHNRTCSCVRVQWDAFELEVEWATDVFCAQTGGRTPDPLFIDGTPGHVCFEFTGQPRPSNLQVGFRFPPVRTEITFSGAARTITTRREMNTTVLTRVDTPQLRSVIEPLRRRPCPEHDMHNVAAAHIARWAAGLYPIARSLITSEVSLHDCPFTWADTWRDFQPSAEEQLVAGRLAPDWGGTLGSLLATARAALAP